MKINRLHINSFGCLENVSLSFSSGFHLIDGPNESGKSTLHAFMRAMLFGLDKGRTRMAKDSGYSRYLPWNGNPAYGGSLEIEDEADREGKDVLSYSRNYHYAITGEATIYAVYCKSETVFVMSYTSV